MEVTLDQVKEFYKNEPGWIKANGLEIEELEKDKAVVSVKLHEDLLNPHGIAHGGLIFGLADSTMGILATVTGRKVVTVDANISYLRPCGGEKLTCVATPVKVGMTLAVYKADIFNDKDDLAATVQGTFYFLEHDIKK